MHVCTQLCCGFGTASSAYRWFYEEPQGPVPTAESKTLGEMRRMGKESDDRKRLPQVTDAK
ncbi:hypothetical protein E4U09_002155 [Claviceps aff. purpurea]|uniref:Uncharacterized protein n=1 Tax=Claviceps aff. purpurea TaxID=1967640 RepID=A0A9P7QH04_9HYPO|nr:hypothetical protein E4U38_006386 [Claviceps purpurea]KAG6295484.1 hypothetical protein E4U09_002155 [Claviceps aff. purpurea]KAG6192270.1 hypothetical protein E4U27_003575 [Claviceps purpurea]KAG6211771.1 hypothetical protein E4U35_001875 [Claviceps purpurea]KAG6237945.1 hypothetical protein E4U25_002159 [Claviceps purpurea]